MTKDIIISRTRLFAFLTG